MKWVNCQKVDDDDVIVKSAFQSFPVTSYSCKPMNFLCISILCIYEQNISIMNVTSIAGCSRQL